ncbi:hypothetical protein [Hansschlegelia zhihuaiae]|uniref:Uncharacterized protein n=1 Tax=Hansschlegelia zhihuaiae TaxID=405005 RepID=A0A4Q0MJZ2_9HYPH|nr:hypothetical protein [Hansschlegelia zhihuaiae]RXF73306.1 hypothetical protein EK403_10785 [Hansschlegelia zhihuaiae]
MPDVEKRDRTLIILGYSDVIFLFFYYLIIIIIGSGISILFITRTHTPDSLEFNALIAAFSMASAGAAVFNTRRLYRACINESFSFKTRSEMRLLDEDSLRRIGSIAFFIFRPAFGAAFSLVIYAMWRLSIAASVSQEITPASGFLYITLALGFLSGFLAGRVLTILEGQGLDQLRNVVSGDGRK